MRPWPLLGTALFALASACGDSSDGGGAFAGAGGGAASGGAGGTANGGGSGLSGAGGSGAGVNLDAGFQDGDRGDGAGGNEGCGTSLTGMIRDFTDAHPDFEHSMGDDRGIVLADLGKDGKPVYAGEAGNPTTHGQTPFNQWYRDTPGVNASQPFTLTLKDGGNGVFSFEDGEFFPIDGKLLGNQGRPHNYHFTFELHTKFRYSGGEVFTFTGDDDVFVFVNGKLGIDLGGVHGAESQTIKLDASAVALGIVRGGTYALDFFFAERHTVDSHFRIDTELTFIDCGGGVH